MRRNLKATTAALMMITVSILASGCWNYREINDMSIVAGIAIDKGSDKNFLITSEIVKINGGKDAKMESLFTSTEGDTVFDAIRNQISVFGRKLYWSHATTLIISKEIAENGVLHVIDWFLRDSEARGEVNVFISREDTAKKILVEGESPEDIKSFSIEKSLKNEKSLSKAPQSQLWEIVGSLSSKGLSPIAPAISLKKDNGKSHIQIAGTAVFKKDKLIGFLNEDDTKALLFIKDKIEGGVIPLEVELEGSRSRLTMIFKSKTKIKPKFNEEGMEIEISIETEVGIAEIEGTGDFIKKLYLEELEQKLNEKIKRNIEDIVKKVQEEFDSDIFGLGEAIHAQKPREWEKLEKDWGKLFKEVKVSALPKLHIKGSSMMAKALKPEN